MFEGLLWLDWSGNGNIFLKILKSVCANTRWTNIYEMLKIFYGYFFSKEFNQLYIFQFVV